MNKSKVTLAFWCFVVALIGFAATTAFIQSDEPIARTQQPEPGPVDVAQKDLQVVYFGAKWCLPCRVMKPILRSLEKEHNIKPVIIDVDEYPDFAEKMGVRAVPTVLFLYNGKIVEVDGKEQRYEGYQKLDVLVAKYKKLREIYPPEPKPDPNPDKPVDEDDSGLDFGPIYDF